MQPIKITVSSTRAVCSERPDPITTGMVGLRAEFIFSDDWDGLQKTAVCAGSGVTKDVLVVQDEITVPHECLTDPASDLKIGLYGTNSTGNIVIPTVYAYCGRLFRGADPSGDTSTDYTLPIWAQIQAMIGDLSNLTTTARDNLVAAINEAAKSGGGGGGTAADVRMQVAGGYIQYSTDGGTTWRNLIAMEDLIGEEGVGIQSVEQTTTSTEDSGINVITVTKTDGATSTFEVRNGGKGGAGKSAYQYAQDGGYTGTEAEFSARMAAEIPSVDSTLTQSGQAADAAVVGNRLSALSEEIANKAANVYIGPVQPTDGTLYWLDTSESGSSGGETVTYSITAALTNVTIDNTAESANEGESFAAALTVSVGYELTSVKITMGGADITNTAYASGNIYISAVTGDVVITAVAVEISGGVTTYTITNNLVNVTSDNSDVAVEENASYTATLTATDGYTLDGATVTITMGGVDVTSDVYADGVITIPAVTGDVVIAVTAIAPNPNLLESNIYGEYSASFSLSLSNLEALNREKLYMVLYSNSEYGTKLTARVYSNINYSWASFEGTWKTAEYTYTDVVQNAEYTHSRVYEMTIENLRADIQTLIDAGTIKEADGKSVQFHFGSSVKLVKVLYTYDVSQSV